MVVSRKDGEVTTNLGEYEYSFVYAKIGTVGFVRGGNSAFATDARDVDTEDKKTLVALKVPVQDEKGVDVVDDLPFYVSSLSNIQFFDVNKNPISMVTDSDGLYPIKSKTGHLTVYAAALSPVIANLMFLKASDENNPAIDVVFIPTLPDGVLPGITIGNNDGVIPLDDSPGPFVNASIPYMQKPNFPPASTNSVVVVNDTVASDVVELQAMMNGISLPKVKLVADGSRNKIYYLVCNSVFDTAVSVVTAYRASGSQSNHPDPNVSPRAYPKPTLRVRTVNNTAIFGGLAVNIPPSDLFQKGDKITLTSYANGYVPGTNASSGQTITSVGTVIDPTKTLTILVQEAPLHGISRSQAGIMGTYEADYVVSRAGDTVGTSMYTAPYAMSTD